MKMPEAKRLAQQAWRMEHPDYNANWRAMHPKSNLAASLRWQGEHRERVNAYARTWRVEHPGAAVIAAIKARNTKQAKLAGRKRPKQCDVCKKSSWRICFDHDHVTGGFRGWLCLNCNSALGFTKDSTKLLLKLAKYLERPLPCYVVYTGSGYVHKAVYAAIGLRPATCQVCRLPGRICIDHCHKKNLVRGWLCNGCNCALGRVHDSAKLLRSLADYLSTSKRRQGKKWQKI